jgi:multiple sugar transport system substrate-binding protein
LWATSAEQMKISAARGNPPVRFSVFNDPELTSQDKFRYFPTLLTAMTYSTPRPRHPRWPEIENAFGVELSKALTGAESPEDALRNAQAAIERIVAR